MMPVESPSDELQSSFNRLLIILNTDALGTFYLACSEWPMCASSFSHGLVTEFSIYFRFSEYLWKLKLTVFTPLSRAVIVHSEKCSTNNSIEIMMAL